MFDSLFAWLDTSVGALAKRVLQALGIGWISFESMSELASQMREAFATAWGGIPADLMQFASLAGFGTAFGIIFGALMYRVAMTALGKLGRVMA